MPAQYPAALYTPRTMANRPGAVYDALKTKVIYAEDLNKDRAEIVAVETELGINPKGAFASVAAYLAALAGDISDLFAAISNLTSRVEDLEATCGKVMFVGLQTSAQTTTSLSFVNVNNAQTTITLLGGRRTVIQFGAFISKSNTSYQCDVGIAIDGTNQSPFCSFSGAAANVVQWITGTLVVDGLSAGAHTLNLRWRVASASTTAQMPVYQHYMITAYEL